MLNIINDPGGSLLLLEVRSLRETSRQISTKKKASQGALEIPVERRLSCKEVALYTELVSGPVSEKAEELRLIGDGPRFADSGRDPQRGRRFRMAGPAVFGIVTRLEIIPGTVPPSPAWLFPHLCLHFVSLEDSPQDDQSFRETH